MGEKEQELGERIAGMEAASSACKAGNEAAHDRIEATIESSNKRVETVLARLDTAIRGNGGKPGITTRLDRLEQVEKRRTLWIRSTMGTSIAAIVVAVRQWVMTKFQ